MTPDAPGRVDDDDDVVNSREYRSEFKQVILLVTILICYCFQLFILHSS